MGEGHTEKVLTARGAETAQQRTHSGGGEMIKAAFVGMEGLGWIPELLGRKHWQAVVIN